MKWSPDWIATPEPALPEPVETRSWLPVEVAPAAASDGRGIITELERVDRAAEAARHAELEEAFSRGFEEGSGEALRREAERIRLVVQSLERAVEEVRTASGMWVENAKEHICALAIAVAQHIVGREVQEDSHVVMDLTRKALADFPADEPVRVKMHPEDLSALTALAADAVGGVVIASGRSVKWQADEAVKRGGCIVEGRGRVVDGRVDHALERIWMRLTE